MEEEAIAADDDDERYMIPVALLQPQADESPAPKRGGFGFKLREKES
jgi:hypothetical protein